MESILFLEIVYFYFGGISEAAMGGGAFGMFMSPKGRVLTATVLSPNHNQVKKSTQKLTYENYLASFPNYSGIFV
jgi:hypothetical protein